MKNIIKIVITLIALSLVAFGAHKKIVVDLTKQEAYAYENGKLIYSGWISSGRAKFKTKRGHFRVLQKEEEHISNEYPKKVVIKKGKKVEEVGGAKMPFMLRITWSGIALHEGYTPNYPASHGCIRVAKGFAKKLYDWASVGTRVIIKGKAPKHVARVHKSFRFYYASIAKPIQTKTHISKRSKIIDYYAKFSYKKLNRILRKKSNQKRYLLHSKKYSYSKKVQKLRKIKWLVKVIKQAKKRKYNRRAHSLHKWASNNISQRYKINKQNIKHFTFNNSLGFARYVHY